MVANIQPTEIDGKHYVEVNLGGQETNRLGPFLSADAAAAMAARLAGVCRGLLHSNRTMESRRG